MPTAATHPAISVVLPCLNEAEAVSDSVRAARLGIERSQLPGEVIVVDNGSIDDSARLASEAGARIVFEPRPGYGSALLRGFAEAQGGFIVMADADRTYDLAGLADLVAELDDGYDLAIGNRLADVHPGAMPWLHRRVGTPTISWLLRRTWGVSIRDSQSGFRALTRAAIDRLQLRSTGMEFASEMIIKSAVQGLRVTEVPSSYGLRGGGSKLRTLRDGWRHLRLILLLAPGLLYVLPGAALLVLSALTFVIGFSFTSVEVGGLSWQPIFAGPIFWILGVTGLALGLTEHQRLVRIGLSRPSRILGLGYPLMRLEVSLVVAALAVFVGLGIDAYIFVRWVSGAEPHPVTIQLAALAQSFIVSGVNLAFIGFFGTGGATVGGEHHPSSLTMGSSPSRDQALR